MLQQAINTGITFVVSSILGYCVSVIKNYKKQKNEIMEEFAQLKESQLMDMRSDLASKFYVYDSMDEVEDYLVISFQEKMQRYFLLGGNSYLHQLYEKSKQWRVKPTGYLK